MSGEYSRVGRGPERVRAGARARRFARAGCVVTGGAVGVQSYRHRQPWRGRHAADPRRPGAQRRGRRRRSRPSRSTPTPSAPRRSSARPTSPTRSARPSARPYLDHAVLERALRETGADAAWVGWGFVAEDPAFAELCERLGVTFIGPSAEAMRKLGDKIGSKLIAEEVGVPVAPWSRGAVDTLEDALAASKDDRLPADAQGDRRRRRPRHPGGRRPTTTWPTPTSAPATRRPRAFGSGVVFLERLVTGARHVEVQVIADGQGTAWALGVRDCSVQRRNQKVIEESASPVLDPEQAAELKASAERLALAVGYRGAGTVEFLYHPRRAARSRSSRSTPGCRSSTRSPRLTTDVDLVKAQIHVAAGGRLEGDAAGRGGPRRRGPAQRRGPRPRLRARRRAGSRCCELPAGPGIRVDTGVSEGDTIPADFDSMIAKIIAVRPHPRRGAGPAAPGDGRDHRVIEGGATNKSFVLDLLDQPEVDRRQRRHRLDRPGPRRGPAGLPPALRRRAGRGRHRGLRGRGAGRAASGCSRPRTAAARRPSTRSAAPSTSSCAARRTG